jgi:hypothetical protein
MMESPDTPANLHVIGTGWVFIIAGIVQVFHQAINPHKERRGAKRAELDFSRLSFRSIFPGIVLIAIGVLLLSISSLAADH